MSKDSRSDHILMINVMKEWEILKRAHNSTRNFCYDNFLSENVLQMLSNHKKQLADHLYAKSFICSSDPKGNNYFTSFFLIFIMITSVLYTLISRKFQNLVPISIPKMKTSFVL